MFPFAIQHTHVRAKEFVCRTCQKVAVEFANVNRPMRCVMDGIDISQRASLMSQSHDCLHVIDRSHRIGRVASGHNFCPRAYLSREVIHVERAVFFPDVDKLDFYSTLLESTPGRDVRIVIQMSKQDLVSCAKLTPNGAADCKCQGG